VKSPPFSRLVEAYVRGVAKKRHRPRRSSISRATRSLRGFPRRKMHTSPYPWTNCDRTSNPSKAGIAAGAHAVLMGPAVFEATETPDGRVQSRPELIDLLRDWPEFRRASHNL